MQITLQFRGIVDKISIRYRIDSVLKQIQCLRAMSSVLLKDAPQELHEWLRSEAAFNRRSLNQQIIFDLEWCMRTFGDPMPRLPVNAMQSRPASAVRRSGNAAKGISGRELARRLAASDGLDDASAASMKRDAADTRKSKSRDFDYACFD